MLERLYDLCHEFVVLLVVPEVWQMRIGSRRTSSHGFSYAQGLLTVASISLSVGIVYTARSGLRRSFKPWILEVYSEEQKNQLHLTSSSRDTLFDSEFLADGTMVWWKVSPLLFVLSENVAYHISCFYGRQNNDRVPNIIDSKVGDDWESLFGRDQAFQPPNDMVDGVCQFTICHITKAL